jgi:predicted nucleic acid-binding protein
VTASWCIQSQSTPYSNAVLASLGENRAHVPEIWRYEIANILLVAERRRSITRSTAMEFLKFLNNFSIDVVVPDGKEWVDLLLWMGATHKLSAYDTAYLHLAMDRGWPLAAKDKKLLAAAKSAGVARYEP